MNPEMENVLYILIIFVATGSWQPCHADISACDAYDTFEDQVQCGPNGYPLHYGKRNCINFNTPANVAKFTPAGQAFCNCTTYCLIDALRTILSTPPVPDCDALTDAAFATHTTCYLNCNFCAICGPNKLALLSTYDLTDFLSLRALAQVYDVASHCGPLGINCLL